MDLKLCWFLLLFCFFCLQIAYASYFVDTGTRTLHENEDGWKNLWSLQSWCYIRYQYSYTCYKGEVQTCGTWGWAYCYVQIAYTCYAYAYEDVICNVCYIYSDPANIFQTVDKTLQKKECTAKGCGPTCSSAGCLNGPSTNYVGVECYTTGYETNGNVKRDFTLFVNQNTAPTFTYKDGKAITIYKNKGVAGSVLNSMTATDSDAYIDNDYVRYYMKSSTAGAFIAIDTDPCYSETPTCKSETKSITTESFHPGEALFTVSFSDPISTLYSNTIRTFVVESTTLNTISFDDKTGNLVLTKHLAIYPNPSVQHTIVLRINNSDACDSTTCTMILNVNQSTFVNYNISITNMALASVDLYDNITNSILVYAIETTDFNRPLNDSVKCVIDEAASTPPNNFKFVVVAVNVGQYSIFTAVNPKFNSNITDTYIVAVQCEDYHGSSDPASLTVRILAAPKQITVSSSPSSVIMSSSTTTTIGVSNTFLSTTSSMTSSTTATETSSSLTSTIPSTTSSSTSTESSFSSTSVLPSTTIVNSTSEMSNTVLSTTLSTTASSTTTISSISLTGVFPSTTIVTNTLSISISSSTTALSPSADSGTSYSLTSVIQSTTLITDTSSTSISALISSSSSIFDSSNILTSLEPSTTLKTSTPSSSLNSEESMMSPSPTTESSLSLVRLEPSATSFSVSSSSTTSQTSTQSSVSDPNQNKDRVLPLETNTNAEQQSSPADTGKVVGIVIAVLVVIGIVVAALIMASKLAARRQLFHIKINAIDEMASGHEKTTLEETNCRPQSSNEMYNVRENSVILQDMSQLEETNFQETNSAPPPSYQMHNMGENSAIHDPGVCNIGSTTI